jgi:signal transduction histidine kinase
VTFTAQLGLLLDGAELLSRAVGVERSLAHAEKLAAIGELTARVAHEIRNPLAAARSLAQQLRQDPTSPFSEEHEIIVGELDRVEREVRSLLQFSRRDELRLMPIDLAELAQKTVDDLRPRFEASEVELRFSGDRPVRVTADSERIRQVLINLLENAFDALVGADRGRSIAIDLSSENGTAILHVSDDGPGVEPDVLSRLFEPFYTGKPHGTGLGLAIVKRTIESHGGRIEVALGQPRGLRFRIELPLDHD